MRGLIANTAGKTIEVPIRANYREGLNILEYFISSRGARKGLADTALRTADSGYLTRRLVDVSQDVIIRDDDCGCNDGIVVSKIMDGNRVLETLEERLTGRFVVEPVVDPKTGEVLMEADRMMTADDAKRIADAGIESVKIRSLITVNHATVFAASAMVQTLHLTSRFRFVRLLVLSQHSQSVNLVHSLQ